jgi:predicted kinase
MIKLTDLMKEAKTGSKAIIMGGAAGAGKSTFVNQIKPDLKKAGWEELNADKYVEDKESLMYKNLTRASMKIDKEDLPNAIQTGRNFLYDTTATNVGRISGIKNDGYDIMMIMIYTHPIVSFLRNFSRERKVPTIGVLTSWNNVYDTIEDYKQMFGDQFYLVQTGISPEEEKAVKEFDAALKSGKLKEYFSDLLSSGKYSSSFKKDPTKVKTPEEIAKSKEQLNKQIDLLASQFGQIEKQVAKYKTADMSQAVVAAKSFIKS